MISILIKSISRCLILAGVLSALGFIIPVNETFMILLGFICLELSSNDDSYTAIYFNTEQEEE